jgi:vacuolar-type H+-ATPase subunit H
VAPGSTVAGQGPIGPISGFLERFRRTSGMPARVGDEAAVELAPVFAALDALEREAQALRDGSERMAAQRLHEAREEAAELAVEARERASFERGDALKAGLRAADVETAEILAAGEADARAIGSRGEERLPELVAEVVERVRAAAP